jgi:hypothetical protein
VTFGGNILTPFAKLESGNSVNLLLIIKNRAGIVSWHMTCTALLKCNSRSENGGSCWEAKANANVCRTATGGGVDSGNTDFDDPAVIELHRRHLPDRDWNLGTDENVTRSTVLQRMKRELL